jgi:hypothetical protein
MGDWASLLLGRKKVAPKTVVTTILIAVRRDSGPASVLASSSNWCSSIAASP